MLRKSVAQNQRRSYEIEPPSHKEHEEQFLASGKDLTRQPLIPAWVSEAYRRGLLAMPLKNVTALHL